MSAYLRADAPATMTLALRCAKLDGTYIGEANFNVTATPTAARHVGTVTVPTGTEVCRVGINSTRARGRTCRTRGIIS